jgi:hypothetical protein
MGKKRILLKKYNTGGNSTLDTVVNDNTVRTMPPLMLPHNYLGGYYDMYSDFARARNFMGDLGEYNKGYGEARDAWREARDSGDTEAEKQAKAQIRQAFLGQVGSGVGAVTSTVSGVMEGARGLGSAYSNWRMNNILSNGMRDNLRRQLEGDYRSFAEGGLQDSESGIRDIVDRRRRQSMKIDRNRLRMETEGELGLGGFTGEYIYGLPSNMSDRATAELEKGEYLQTPDGSVVEVAGEKHSKGGTPTDAEGFVVSDQLKVGGSHAKYLRDTYGLHVKASDSFAAVLDKYKSKVGLKKAYETQSSYLTMLEKNGDVKDSATADLNKQYLSGKINDAQKEIDGLTPAFETFTREMYNMQEADKIDDVDGYLFGDGGRIDRSMFDELTKAYGLTASEGRDILMRNLSLIQEAGPDGFGSAFEAGKGGHVRKYGKGSMIVVPNKYRDKYMKDGKYDIGYQRRTDGDFYGDVTTEEAQNRLAEEIRLHPQLLTKGLLKVDTKGAISFAEGKTVADMQDYYNRQFAAVGKTKDFGMKKDEWDRFMYNNTFTPETENINASELDSRYGNFTSTIGTVQKNILMPGEIQALHNMGITHFSQLDNYDVRAMLGGNRVDKILDQYRDEDGKIDDDLDFMLGAFSFDTPQLSQPDFSPLAQVTRPDPGVFDKQELTDANRRVGEKLVKDTNSPPPPGRGSFYDAGWFEVPPSPLQMPSLRQVELNRISPYRASMINPTLLNAEANAAYQLDGMPSNQRGAVASYMLGASQDAANRYFSQASAQNAMQQQQADTYNAQVGDRETMLNTQLGQQYEMLAQKALDNTYNDWANFFGEMGMRNAQRRQNERAYNTMNSLFANYRLNGDGTIGLGNTGTFGNPFQRYIESKRG